MEQLGKILIVDDNEDVLFALNLLLEPYAEKIKVAVTPDRIEYFMTTFATPSVGRKALRVWNKSCVLILRRLLFL